MANIPIFLSADNNYAPFVAITIASICNNTKSFCEFFILDGGISNENKEKIFQLKSSFLNFEVEFLTIDIDKEFSELPNWLHYTKTMYTRFLIPQLKPKLNKILYSDVDVIVLSDIKEMFDENLENYIIGAVSEDFLGDKIKSTYKSMLGLSENHQPFASGNLIIDCAKWRDNDITSKILKIDCSKQDKIKYVDQTLLNVCFDNNYKKLSQKYCYTIQHDVCLKSDDIVICHYNGPIKPWQLSENTNTTQMPYLKEFWHYAKMTPFYGEIVTKVNTKSQKESLKNLQIFRIMAKRNFQNN